jgi:hypothetical protein
MMQSKVIVTPEHYKAMVNDYNKLFARYQVATGVKRAALEMQLEELDAKIKQAYKLLRK